MDDGRLQNQDMTINPYESPQSPTADSDAYPLFWKIRVPGAILLLLCVGQLVLMGAIAAQQLIGFPAFDPIAIPQPVSDELEESFSFVLFATWVMPAMIYWAYRMIWLRDLLISRGLAIAACIPFLSPMIVLGIPVGIWLVFVLFQPTTAAVFKMQESSPN